MLALHTITRSHAGRYECEATNDAGVDAARIDIIVGKCNNRWLCDLSFQLPRLSGLSIM